MTTSELTPCDHSFPPSPGMAEAIRATRAALMKVDARLASGFEEAITRLLFDRMLRKHGTGTREEVAR